MRQFGDLQPSGKLDFTDDRPAHGRYTASRSRWRFAVGSIEIGFDRERERVLAQRDPPRPQITVAQLPAPVAPPPSFAVRFMSGLGAMTAIVLITGVSGWFWSMRSGAAVGREVSTSIVDMDGDETARNVAETAPTVIPTRRRTPVLRAVIQPGTAGPVVAPAESLSATIADGHAFGAAAPEPVPSLALIRSGNFTAIGSVSRALDEAMATGEVQNWTAGPYHGVVVVGDADAGQCRKGTVLLRDGSPNGKTQSFERCAR